MIFAIDIPDWFDPWSPWRNFDYYETREEALRAAKEVFGADEEGRICIVGDVGDDDEL